MAQLFPQSLKVRGIRSYVQPTSDKLKRGNVQELTTSDHPLRLASRLAQPTFGVRHSLAVPAETLPVTFGDHGTSSAAQSCCGARVHCYMEVLECSNRRSGRTSFD